MINRSLKQAFNPLIYDQLPYYDFQFFFSKLTGCMDCALWFIGDDAVYFSKFSIKMTVSQNVLMMTKMMIGFPSNSNVCCFSAVSLVSALSLLPRDWTGVLHTVNYTQDHRRYRRIPHKEVKFSFDADVDIC